MNCLAPPLGCGRDIFEWELVSWDSRTLREFQMSGWCDTCQDVIFAEPDDEDDDYDDSPF